MTAALETRDLAIGYGDRVVIRGIDAQLEPGQFVCLIGPNGAGKSTLIRTLAGMQPVLAGSVVIGERPLNTIGPRELARQLSVVLTERVDAGNLSVWSLVALGRHPHTDWRGSLSEHDRRIVDDSLAAVGAIALTGRQVNQLSDGERQKVMIARALAQEPQLMILDEPTAFLDLPRRVETMRVLRRLVHSGDRAILLSTHDLDLALRSADAVWLLEPGGPLTVGAPEDLVLTGVFERAFAAEGVHFDRDHGAFRVDVPHAGRVVFTGEGLRAYWTRRALDRLGYDVLPAGDGPRVELTDTAWYVADTPCPDIATLAKALAELHG